MAFALVAGSVKAFGTEVSEPLTKRFVQIFQLSFTALAADVALDLGNLSGTFWTAVANPEARNIWSRIQVKAETIMLVQCAPIMDAKTKVGGAPATGQYRQVSTPAGLAITQFAGEGVTAGTITLQVLLKAGQYPEEFNNV
jgi:hypothetical protein